MDRPDYDAFMKRMAGLDTLGMQNALQSEARWAEEKARAEKTGRQREWLDYRQFLGHVGFFLHHGKAPSATVSDHVPLLRSFAQSLVDQGLFSRSVLDQFDLDSGGDDRRTS